MPSALVTTEVVIGTLVVLVAVALVATYLRRRYIAGGLPLTVCGMRAPGADRWRVGLVRFGEASLEWYSLGGLSLRPRHRWARQTLELEAPQRIERKDMIRILPDAYRVPASDRGVHFELGLQPAAYTALRSWQEAAPPGYNVNVA